MEFDVSRVYTAVNADNLKVGSKVIVANTLEDLKKRVKNNKVITRLTFIEPEDKAYRFRIINAYNFAYLVEEPTTLKWTDLKVGDVITNKKITSMIVRIDTDDVTHILAGNVWLNDEELKEWEKVEK